MSEQWWGLPGPALDRDGKPIDFWRWGELIGDREYAVIAKDDLDGVYVSTVWIGLSLALTDPPLIFETMVFDQEGDDVETHRYATEAEARAGHERIVSELRLLRQAVT